MSCLYEPRRLFNCDESGFAIGGRAGTRVLAAGDVMPPLIIVPAKRREVCGRYMDGAPNDAMFSATENGWIDSKSFFSFVANMFYPYIVSNNIPLPVLLLVDGHSSHQSPEVHQFCSDHNIILYRFPPHATHILQPCDVSFFKCLKAEWYLAERAFRIDHPGFFVTKTGFAGAFRPASEKAVKKPGVVANRFRAAGLYPYTRQYIKEHVMPSSTG